MTTRRSIFLRIFIILAIYFGATYFGGIWGWRLFYPVRIFVTFLHEFGHAFGALITGGAVEYIRIDPNAGGVTSSLGGNRPVIIMGGYLGSALFGNLLFYIGATKPRLVKPVLSLVIFTMLVSGFIWYKSLFTTLVLCAFAAFLFFIEFKTKYGRDVLMFLGLASVIYILQDTTSGPSSDLLAFEREMGFFSNQTWMVIWFILALAILAWNVKMLLGIKDETPPTTAKGLK
jgi:hypothetical protein